MTDKIAVDTNILIYSIQSESAYFNYCLNFLENNLNNIVITTKNISEFIAVLSKKDIEYSDIKKYLIVIKSKFKILYHTPDSISLFYKLIDKYSPKGNRVYDFEIISIMLANGITKIATINKKDFENITEIILV